jgi:hypothetical protein
MHKPDFETAQPFILPKYSLPRLLNDAGEIHINVLIVPSADIVTQYQQWPHILVNLLFQRFQILSCISITPPSETDSEDLGEPRSLTSALETHDTTHNSDATLGGRSCTTLLCAPSPSPNLLT